MRHRWTSAASGLEWECMVCGTRARGPFRIVSGEQMDAWLEGRWENRDVPRDCHAEVVRKVLEE